MSTAPETNRSKDNDTEITSAHEWLAHVAELLELPGGIERHSVGPILDLTKDVAHNRSRPSAPVTAFLVGLAAGLRTPDGADQDRIREEIDRAIAAVKAEATD